MEGKRNVNIHLEPEVKAKIEETTGWEKLGAIIGYLSTWNMGGFSECSIFHDGDLDLLATYKNPGQGVGYTIGAVWHEDHYGLHS